MKKIIFLDLDGVLNTGHYQHFLTYNNEAWQDKHGMLFDPAVVQQLKRIIDATHADIVIESSWKHLGLEAMQTMWTDREMPGKVIDITPTSISDRFLLGATSDSGMRQCKGVEIECWLGDNGSEDMRYVIIDDEYVIMDFQMPFFLQVDSYSGLTEEIADKAIEILNGE